MLHDLHQRIRGNPMAYFQCRTRIRIRTRIPVLYKYHGKEIQIRIRVSGIHETIKPCSHKVWNLSPSLNLNPSLAVEISHASLRFWL